MSAGYTRRSDDRGPLEAKFAVNKSENRFLIHNSLETQTRDDEDVEVAKSLRTLKDYLTANPTSTGRDRGV